MSLPGAAILDRSAPTRRLTYSGYLGFILIGWNSVIVPSLIRSIEHDFKQSDAAFALFYFVSALMYGLGAFLGGVLTERVGRRVVLPVGAALFGFGLFGEALAPSWPVLLAATLPVNWGGGVIDGGTNGLFLEMYRHARGGALSLLHVFFSAGALIGPLITGVAIGIGINWRMVPLLAGISVLSLLGMLMTTSMPSGQHDGTKVDGDAAVAVVKTSSIPFAALAVGIGLSVAAEGGVSNWMVRLLADVPIQTATVALSMYWVGLAAGRLLSNRIAERMDYFAFTTACIILESITLALALASPWVLLTIGLFTLSGFFIGPIFPMIVAIGGTIYPHRVAALGGSLAASAVAGSLIYPPLIGLMASRIGIRGGLFGAALLGIPMAVALLLARTTAGRRTV